MLCVTGVWTEVPMRGVLVPWCMYQGCGECVLEYWLVWYVVAGFSCGGFVVRVVRGEYREIHFRKALPM